MSLIGTSGLVAREPLGERVAEAHVDRALDLALAEHRVDGATDVVGGDDLLDVAGVGVHDHDL